MWSKEIKTFLKLILSFFILALLFRLLFLFAFKGSSRPAYTNPDLLKAFYIGSKFDLRAAIIFSLPFWFLGYSLKLVNAIFEEKDRQMFLSKSAHPTLLLKFIFSFLLSLYSAALVIDLNLYKYLEGRINAQTIDFTNNPLLALQLTGGSFSIPSLALIFFISFAFFFFTLHRFVFRKNIFVSGEYLFKTSFLWSLPLIVLFAALAHGRLNRQSLVTMDAQFHSSKFINSLGLNPLLYFYESLQIKNKVGAENTPTKKSGAN